MFYISVKESNGREVQLRAGAQGERDLIAEVLAKVEAQGVGIFRTESKVLAAVQQALHEVLLELKSEVIP